MASSGKIVRRATAVLVVGASLAGGFCVVGNLLDWRWGYSSLSVATQVLSAIALASPGIVLGVALWTWGKRAAGGVIAAILLAVFLGLWLPQYHFFRYTRDTCSRCRAIRTTRSWLGTKSHKTESTEYSIWFTANNPPHSHKWCWSGTRVSYSLLEYGIGCGRQHPIWHIPPYLQRTLVEDGSPDEVAQFYSYLDSEDRDERQKADEMVWQSA